MTQLCVKKNRWLADYLFIKLCRTEIEQESATLKPQEQLPASTKKPAEINLACLKLC